MVLLLCFRRYVGSPYQTSLSEADQAKYLYEVSLLPPEPGHERRNWKETSRWPLLVGKRYYKVRSHFLHNAQD